MPAETPFREDNQPEPDIEEATARFLDDLDHLDAPTVTALASAGADCSEAEIEAREGLREELRGIAEWSGRLDACRDMSDAVERWVSSVRHWFPAGIAATADARSQISTRMSAVRVVLDAAYGVVLADLLKPDEAELLLRPWRDVLGDRTRTGRPSGQHRPYRAARTRHRMDADGPSQHADPADS